MPRITTGNIKFVICIPRPVKHLWEMLCSGSVSNVAGLLALPRLILMLENYYVLPSVRYNSAILMSRFHVLKEFDEGKRCCCRCLAGHNKRWRKAHPENLVNGGSMINERGSSYLLISLLRILSNMHTNSFDQTKDQDLLSHLLKE